MFKKAVKHESKLRLAIAGPSGSGKTYSALRIATALGKTAVIDTESGSASKYADIFDFDVLEMEAPFSPQRYIDAVKAAKDAGYDVIVIDSLTHAWTGTGGVLDIKDGFAKQSAYNDYTAWGPAGKVQITFVEALIRSGIHLIATMRSKTKYVMEEYTKGNGQKGEKPVKVGMAPVQRDDVEYEFDLFFEMDIENNAVVSKTRFAEFHGKVFYQPGEDVAQMLMSSLSGAPPPHWTESPPASPTAALNTIMENVPRYSGNKNAAVNVVKKFLPDGKEWTSLSKAERTTLLKKVEEHAAKRDKEEAADAVSAAPAKLIDTPEPTKYD